MMKRRFFIALLQLIAVGMMVSCKEEAEETEWTVFNTEWATRNKVPTYETYEQMVRVGNIRAKATKEDRRVCETLFVSMQTHLEDLTEKAADPMKLPIEYPELFEMSADTVRQIVPKYLACCMDSQGLFYACSKLHKVRGHVYAVGEGASEKSLTEFLDGKEPEEGYDYVMGDIYQAEWEKTQSEKE